MTDLKSQVESILFASGKFVTLDELKKLTGATENELKKALANLEEDLSNRSLMLVEDKGSYKLNVKEKYSSLVEQVVTETELPKSIMETLAIIAFKHPILQVDLVKIRSNKAYDHLAELEQSGFIRRERFGRTKRIDLTQKFFDYFDVPPNKVKEAFTSFEAVSKAIDGQEKVLEKKLEVYELKKEEEQKEEEQKEEEQKKEPFLEIVDSDDLGDSIGGDIPVKQEEENLNEDVVKSPYVEEDFPETSSEDLLEENDGEDLDKNLEKCESFDVKDGTDSDVNKDIDLTDSADLDVSNVINSEESELDKTDSLKNSKIFDSNENGDADVKDGTDSDVNKNIDSRASADLEKVNSNEEESKKSENENSSKIFSETDSFEGSEEEKKIVEEIDEKVKNLLGDKGVSDDDLREQEFDGLSDDLQKEKEELEK